MYMKKGYTCLPVKISASVTSRSISTSGPLGTPPPLCPLPPNICENMSCWLAPCPSRCSCLFSPSSPCQRMNLYRTYDVGQ